MSLWQIQWLSTNSSSQCANSRNSNSFPQESYIRNEFRISCLQTGHLGVDSRSTEIAHSWQHTKCPHGMNADRLLLIRQITHNSPSGTSPVSSSDAIWVSASGLAAWLCRWSCLFCLHSFHLFQFLKTIINHVLKKNYFWLWSDQCFLSIINLVCHSGMKQPTE